MHDTTAVVTGASRGIGLSVALALGDAGATTIVGSRDASAIEETVEAIRASGASATGLRTDVRDEFDVERLMETASRTGNGNGIDLLVANAGIYHGEHGETPLSRESYAAFDDTMRTNLRGVFTTVREAIPHLAPDGRVLVPTEVDRETRTDRGAYGVSKAAVEALVGSFAAELDQTIGCLDPGRVRTDLDPDGDRDPYEVAPMFVWAARDLPSERLDGRTVTIDDWRAVTA